MYASLCQKKKRTIIALLPLKAEKSKYKALERPWRKDYAPAARLTYKLAIKGYHALCNAARAEHTNNTILMSHNSPKVLFKVVKELSGTTCQPEPPGLNVAHCEDLAELFIDKIDKIYAEFNNTTTNVELLPETFASSLDCTTKTLSQDINDRPGYSLDNWLPLEPLPFVVF